MGKITIETMGQHGQEMAKDMLKRLPHMDKFCQLDWLVRNKSGQWWLVEVKYQAHFTAPPFDGHGLPRWQVGARMQLWKEKGIRPLLWIFDYGSRTIYAQWLDILEAGRSHDTWGKKPRRVYPLESFEVLGEFDAARYRVGAFNWPDDWT